MTDKPRIWFVQRRKFNRKAEWQSYDVPFYSEDDAYVFVLSQMADGNIRRVGHRKNFKGYTDKDQEWLYRVNYVEQVEQ